MKIKLGNRHVDRLLDLARRFPPAVTEIGAEGLDIDAFRSCAGVFRDRLTLLERCYGVAPKTGLVLEFGVDRGRSIRVLAKQDPGRRIFGFDSFEGLPEDWVRSETSAYEAGTFAAAEPPEVPSNVTLVRGFFDQSLPAWLAENPGEVALLHIDSDLYSSAKCVLGLLNDRLPAGAVIVFDDLCDWRESGVYSNWREGEWRALGEWMAEKGRTISVLGRDSKYSGAVQILR